MIKKACEKSRMRMSKTWKTDQVRQQKKLFG